MQRLAGRRSRASPTSTSANFVRSGVLSTKPRHRRISTAICWCELSHTGCRKSLLAGCVRGPLPLHQIAQEFKETGDTRLRAPPELKPETRLVREGQGRTYAVLVLDD